MLKTKEEIIIWLKKYRINFYNINNDLTVDVFSSVNLSLLKLKEIPIKFGKVHGNFFCHRNFLTNLNFSPTEVDGDFNCANNNLLSLENCPAKINGKFYCYNNKIIKESLYSFDTNIQGVVSSDFGTKGTFLLLVEEQKILKEKKYLSEKINPPSNIYIAVKKRI